MVNKNEIIDVISTLNENVNFLTSELTRGISNVDLELSDLYHLLENRKEYKVDAPTLSKITIKIAELRNKRREVKDYLLIVQRIKPKINGISQSVNDTVKIQNTPTYKPKTNIYESFGISIEKRVIIKT